MESWEMQQIEYEDWRSSIDPGPDGLFLEDASSDRVTAVVVEMAELWGVIRMLPPHDYFYEEYIRPCLEPGDYLGSESDENASFPGMGGPWFTLTIHDPERFRRTIRNRVARALRERRPALSDRYDRLRTRFGMPPEGTEVDFYDFKTWYVAAYDPEAGLLAVDDLERPRSVRLIVRDPASVRRLELRVPPRFANPRTATYQRLSTPGARVAAAYAWTRNGQREWPE